MTLQQQIQATCRMLTAGQRDSLVKTLACAATKSESAVKEADCFIKLLTCSKARVPKIDPDGYVLKDVCSEMIISELTSISINCGADFTEVLYQISEVGYDCEWQVINSKLYVPQNRERVFIIGHFRADSPRQIFPITGTATEATGEMLEVIGGRQGNRVYCPHGISSCLTAQTGGFSGKTGLYCAEKCDKPKFIDLNTTNPITTNIARCLKARYNAGVSNRNELSGVITDGKIRWLTPKECFRLQGFSDAMFERAAAVTSDNQLYKQAGNSVTVPVVREIGKRLMKVYGDDL
jgi:DNA (cytosine-5)-methyltransferase 1